MEPICEICKDEGVVDVGTNDQEIVRLCLCQFEDNYEEDQLNK